MDTSEPPYKKLKLSLEAPYKDDNGEPIQVLLDITPQGEHIYEPKDDRSTSLGETLRRVFAERGLDLFDKVTNGQGFGAPKDGEHDKEVIDDELPEASSSTQAMTTTELYKMRYEIVPNLRTALGEMAQAKELLTLLLASSSQTQAPPVQSAFSLAQGTAAPVAAVPSNLTATNIAKADPIISVAAFNKQLVIGGKDEALRKASTSFKTASESIERARLRGEKYWVDALKIRKANWGLIPAPLPFGSATGKGADKTSKDFLVSFGLEESPSHFRQRAVGRMSTYETESGALVFPLRQNTRLRVSLATIGLDGLKNITHNTPRPESDDTLDSSLKAAQQEIVEHEIFGTLVKEASQLLTASARVSERIVAVEAAENVELILEMVDTDLIGAPQSETSTETEVALCDLIYHLLHALLLRLHAYVKKYRLGVIGVIRALDFRAHMLPPLLQPIIDLLQYEVFCERVRTEVHKVVNAMSTAGIPASLRFDVVGESGRELVNMFDDEIGKHVGGEAVLRIDNRHTVRLTMLSPSTLVAHLPQATMPISSISQLCQLLSDEMEHYLLTRICELGTSLSENVSGTWFVDPVTSRSVGRWEGCVVNFQISYGPDFAIECSAFRMSSGGEERGSLEAYSCAEENPLTEWATKIIQKALSEPFVDNKMVL